MANLLQKIIWKVLPPIEVTATKKDVVAFLNQHAGMSQQELHANTNRLLNDCERVIYSIRCDKMKPAHLALLLITKAADFGIQSGQYHVYRGVLDIVGNDMLKVFILASKAMEEHGFQPSAETTKDLAWIYSQVRELG